MRGWRASMPRRAWRPSLVRANPVWLRVPPSRAAARGGSPNPCPPSPTHGIGDNHAMSTALITGAGRGIGLATAQAFVRAGWRVLALDKAFPGEVAGEPV